MKKRRRWLLVLLMLVIVAGAAICLIEILPKRGPKGPTVRFLGAARHVGGSCLLVENAGTRFIVDCGALGERGSGSLPPLPDSLSFVVRTTEFYIPHAQTIDLAAEIRKLEDELVYTRGFLETVDQKLNNEKFINSAPEKVVKAERKKKSDAEARISVLEEQIRLLKGK